MFQSGPVGRSWYVVYVVDSCFACVLAMICVLFPEAWGFVSEVWWETKCSHCGCEGPRSEVPSFP